MKTVNPFKTDRENPELDPADVKSMKPAREVLGRAWVDAQKRGRKPSGDDGPSRR
jgi:hypothetical protein